MLDLEDKAGRVLVTGASGFIASHVVQQLLQAGCNVRGTVRSLANQTKIKHLKSLCVNCTYPLELVEADLTDQQCWTSAVKDCHYVLHIASPFPIDNPKDETELIIPAVEGTKNVLRACASTPTVKRVVLTSSTAAVTDNHKFELAVINPGYVLGPILSGSSCTSMEVIKRLMCRDPPLIPKINFSVVDVRDVAAAHIAAMTLPEARGQRFITTAGNMWMADMSRALNEEFQDKGYHPSQTGVPHFLFKIVAKFDAGARRIAPYWGKKMLLDNSKMKTVLKIELHPMKQTILDMAYSMIEGGFIKKSHRYIGQNVTTDDVDDNMSPESSNLDSTSASANAFADQKSCNPEEKGLNIDRTSSDVPVDNQ